MIGSNIEAQRLFSVQQANAALPLVRAIAQDLSELTKDLSDRRERFEELVEGRTLHESDPYDQELAAVGEQIEADSTRVQEYLDELRQIGVEPQDGNDGRVDFPTLVDGNFAYLSWKLGDDAVMFWHTPEEEFSQRRRLRDFDPERRMSTPRVTGSPMNN